MKRKIGIPHPPLFQKRHIKRPLFSKNGRLMPRIFFLTDSSRLPDPRPAIRALPKGTGVIFRDYDVAERAQKARLCARLCRQRGLVFLVAGDHYLADAIGADGLHLPDRPPYRRLVRPQRPFLITASAHDAYGLRRAETLGADLVFLSPVFPTRSHPGARALGIHRFSRLASLSNIPVFALGGIDRETTRRLPPMTGGVAAISAFKR